MDASLMAMFVILAIALIALVIRLFQYLWNTTMPEVFGLGTITYWQSLRLILMAAILSGGTLAAG